MGEIYRKEIKYIISIEDFMGIRKQLGLYLKRDVNGAIGGYKVRSLYFDSVNNTDLFDSLSGMLSKSKIRMRIYSHDTKQVKLEYKRKFGLDGIKHVLTLSREEALSMICGDYRFMEARQEPLAAELFVRLVTGCYRPQSIVQYDREAYTHPVSNTRLTFDTSVTAAESAGDFFKEYLCTRPIMPPGMGVFEVKYDHVLIGTFSRIVKKLDAVPFANSKYIQSRIGF